MSVQMRKIWIGLCLVMIPWSGLLAKPVEAVYIPLDHIRVPHPGTGWDYRSGSKQLRIEFTEEASRRIGAYPSVVLLSRRILDLSPSAQEWQKAELKDLPQRYQVETPDPASSDLFYINYHFTQNLMQVEGARLYQPQGNWLYLWECQKEQSEGFDLQKWCQELFQKIQWSEDIEIVSPEKVEELDAVVGKMAFAPHRLQKQESALIAELQKAPLNFNKLMAYGAFLMVRSLLYPPPPEQKGILIENFKKMSLIFRKDPRYPAVSEWFGLQAEVLGGSFDLQKAQAAVRSNGGRPPFWLVSLWVEPLSAEIALSMIGRENLDKDLEHYVLGTLCRKTGQTENAVTHLNKSAGQFGELAWEQLAQIYLERKDREKAKLEVDKILKKNPGHINAKLLLANILEGTEETPKLEEAQKIYADLTAKQSLPEDERLRVFLQKAQNSIHPEIQIEYYEKVLEIDPDHLEAIYALGRLYLLEYNDKKKSLGFFEKFIAKAPKEDPRVQELSAMVYDLRNEVYSGYVAQ